MGAYSLLRQTISELGVATCSHEFMCTPYYWLMNSAMVTAGIALIGLAYIFGSIGTHLAEPISARRRRWAVITLIVGGSSKLLTGLIPLDVSVDAHLIVSIPALLTAIPVLLLSPVIKSKRLVGALRILAVISLLAGIITILSIDDPVSGLIERTAVWVPALILVYITFEVRKRFHIS